MITGDMVIMVHASQIVNAFRSKAVLASQLVLLLLWLPLALRMHTIPTLLEHLGRRGKSYGHGAIDLVETMWIITRICNLRLFRSRFFPKHCLRQSLTLYRILSRMGYPVQIHFGVMKDKTGFQGHSWVTLEGKAVADTARSGIFKAVYSHPSARPISACSDRNELKRSKNEHQFSEA